MQHRRCIALAAAEEQRAKSEKERSSPPRRSEKERAEAMMGASPRPESVVPPVLSWVHAEVFRTIVLRYLGGSLCLNNGGGGQVSVSLSPGRGSLLGSETFEGIGGLLDSSSFSPHPNDHSDAASLSSMASASAGGHREASRLGLVDDGHAGGGASGEEGSKPKSRSAV